MPSVMVLNSNDLFDYLYLYGILSLCTLPILIQPWSIHKTTLTSISDYCVLNRNTYVDYIF